MILVGTFFSSCAKKMLPMDEPKPFVLVRFVESESALPLVLKASAFGETKNVKVFCFSFEAKNFETIKEGNSRFTNLPVLFWTSIKDVKDIVESITVIFDGDTIISNSPILDAGYNLCRNFVINPNTNIVEGQIIKGTVSLTIKRMEKYVFWTDAVLRISIDPSLRRPGILDSHNDSIQVNGAARGPAIKFMP